jgi:hypothetical protein
LVTAVLSESINAVTCGSLQTFAGLEAVDPGTVAAGVSAPEVGNGIGAVDVTAGKKVGRLVGVGAASEGEVQAVSRTKPDRSIGTNLTFIVLSLCRTCIQG